MKSRKVIILGNVKTSKEKGGWLCCQNLQNFLTSWCCSGSGYVGFGLLLGLGGGWGFLIFRRWGCFVGFGVVFLGGVLVFCGGGKKNPAAKRRGVVFSGVCGVYFVNFLYSAQYILALLCAWFLAVWIWSYMELQSKNVFSIVSNVLSNCLIIVYQRVPCW